MNNKEIVADIRDRLKGLGLHLFSRASMFTHKDEDECDKGITTVTLYCNIRFAILVNGSTKKRIRVKKGSMKENKIT